MTGIVCTMIGATFGAAAVATITRAKKGLVANGNAKLDTDYAKFDHSSALFDGTGDYVSSAANSDYNFGTSSFTIEFFIRFSTVGTLYVPTALRESVSINNGEWWCEVTASEKKMYWGFKNQAGTQYYVNLALAGTAFAANTWYHIALVNNAGTAQMYIDGTAVGATTSLSGSFGNSTTALWVGAGAGAYSLNGRIDEFRISKTARYTTNFTPTTSQFVNDDNTVLLLHFSGSNLSTVFEDDNGVNRSQKSLSGLGDAQIDTAQSKFGGSSLLLDGTNDRVVYGLINNTGLIPTTGQFTVEAWIRLTSTTGSKAIFAQNGDLGGAAADGNLIFAVEGNKLELTLRTGGANSIKTGTTSLVTNTWYHVALSRDSSNNFKMFLNGTQESTTLTSTQSIRSSYTAFGSLSSSDSYNFPGHIDELRVSDTARYTAAFTPPTEQFVNDTNTILLCHFDGTDGVKYFGDDNGATPVAYTSDAVAFDGTNDYYEATSISTTATDSKYLTFACTFYLASGGNSRNQHLMTARLGTANGENGWEICVQSGRFRYSSFDNSGASTDMVYGDAQHLTEGAWNQMVAYIDHTSFANCKWYVNGVDRTSSLLNGASIGAVNLVNNNINWGNTATTIKIGEEIAVAGYNSGFSDFEGRISQIYVHNASGAPDIGKFWDHSVGKAKDLGTNGTSSGLAQPLIYHYGGTTTFPTNNGTGFASYTLTGYNNVSTNTGNSIYSDARRQLGIIANGNAQIDTAQSKFGGASALFDGTGDYLTIGNPVTGDMAVTGNYWTVEYWARINAHAGAYQATVAIWDDVGSTGNVYYFTTNMYNATQKMGIAYRYNGPSDSDSGAITFGSTLATGTWQHHAFVRNGNTLTAYLDGVSQGTHDMTGRTIDITGFNSSATTSLKLTIGAMTGGGGAFNGWLDEIRISKTARYTANFTAPTAPFTNDTNTVLLIHADGTDASTVFIDDNGIADHT